MALASGSIDLKAEKAAYDDAATKATNYITTINSEGIQVHADNNTTSNYVQINADGMEVYKGGNSVAKYSDTSRVGQQNTRHIEIKDGGLQVYQDSSIIMAHIGYGLGNAESGTVTAPYYTLGTRVWSAPNYNANNTYATGDVCTYNGQLYVCVNTTTGTWTPVDWELTIGNYSTVEGYENIGAGWLSHAEGDNTRAIGACSHTEGLQTIASGYKLLKSATVQMQRQGQTLLR